jgi:hypothetical protein
MAYIGGSPTDVSVMVERGCFFALVVSSARLSLLNFQLSGGGTNTRTSGVIQIEGTAEIADCLLYNSLGVG